MRRINKKASLSLSINAIVVLILAITMLGLGLAFMRNIFGSATDEFIQMGGEVKKQMIEQMKESNKVVDLSNPRLDIKAGNKKQIFIAFKNEGSKGKNMTIRQIDASQLGADFDLDNVYLNENDGSGDIDFTGALGGICGLRIQEGGTEPSQTQAFIEFKRTPTKVGGGETVVLPININAISSASSGTCAYTLRIDTDTDNIAVPPAKDYDKIIELTIDIKN
jgi:hypothetical protein